MRCDKCGKENQENANFCSYCGNLLQKNLDALIQRAKLKDQSALTEIYRYSSPAVYRTVKVLIKDDDTAKDILQDTYIKAFARLDQLQNPDRLVPWLKMIASNTAKDWLKKSKPILFSDMSAGKTFNDLPFEEKIEYKNMELNPEMEVDAKEVQRLLMEILDQLPEDQRMVIGMFYYEEMSVRDIAITLGVSDNTVKSRLLYGRKKIKEQVLDLERRGTRLYTAAPFVFFLYLLRRMQSAPSDASEMAALQNVMESGICSAAQYKVSAGSGTVKNQPLPDTAAAGRGAASGSKAAVGTVAKTAARHTGVKIAAIILAGSVGAGGVTYGLIKNADRLPFDLPFTEKHMTVVYEDKASAEDEASSDADETAEMTVTPEAEETQGREEVDAQESEASDAVMNSTEEALKLIEGTWYTQGGAPYHLKIVVTGNNLKAYQPYMDDEIYFERSISDVIKTDYGYFFQVSYEYGDYGYRWDMSDPESLTIVGTADPNSMEGYSGTDSLVRNK